MSKNKQVIVMEIGNRRAVVLHPDGSFHQLPLRPGLKVGDIISFPRATGRGTRWAALVVAALVVALLYTSAVVLPARQAFAYVSLDGIPGVELAVNGRGDVISGNAISPQGELLLAGLEVGKQSLTVSVQQLFSHAKEQGLLEGDQSVVLVTVAPAKREISKKLLERVNEQASAGVQAALQGQTASPKVEQMLVSKELQAEAKAQGLTPGQYAIALKASEAGVSINLDQLPDKNVAQALHSHGMDPGQIINQLKDDGDLDQLMEQNRGKLHGKTKPEKSESDKDSDHGQGVDDSNGGGQTLGGDHPRQR